MAAMNEPLFHLYLLILAATLAATTTTPAWSKQGGEKNLQDNEESLELRAKSMICYNTTDNGESVAECCEGFQPLNKTTKGGVPLCLPVCDPPCVNAECSAPDECDCYEGFRRVEDAPPHMCLAECDQPCVNAYCVQDNVCECKPGYKTTENRYVCEPEEDVYISGTFSGGNSSEGDYLKGSTTEYGTPDPECSPPCGAFSRCVGLNECVCETGYEPSSARPDECEPVCDPPCGSHAACTAPNTCECFPGYSAVDNGTCVPHCSPPCGIGGECIAPNNCSCDPGYQLDTEGDCIGICDSGSFWHRSTQSCRNHSFSEEFLTISPSKPAPSLWEKLESSLQKRLSPQKFSVFPSESLFEQSELPIKPTDPPTLPIQLTVLPRNTVQSTVQPTVPIQSTALPTLRIQSTALPTLRIQSTALPALRIQSTVLPTFPIQSTALPTLQIQSTALPTLQIQSTALPTLRIQSTVLPTFPIRTVSSTLPMQSTGLPTLPFHSPFEPRTSPIHSTPKPPPNILPSEPQSPPHQPEQEQPTPLFQSNLQPSTTQHQTPPTLRAFLHQSSQEPSSKPTYPNRLLPEISVSPQLSQTPEPSRQLQSDTPVPLVGLHSNTSTHTRRSEPDEITHPGHSSGRSESLHQSQQSMQPTEMSRESLTEVLVTTSAAPLQCSPPCVYGRCVGSLCECVRGWTGTNCALPCTLRPGRRSFDLAVCPELVNCICPSPTADGLSCISGMELKCMKTKLWLNNAPKKELPDWIWIAVAAGVVGALILVVALPSAVILQLRYDKQRKKFLNQQEMQCMTRA